MKDATFHGLNSKCWNKIKTLDFSCQASQKSYRSSICTCRKHKKTQIFKRNTNSEQSSIDLGVERIKVVHKKKIVVYLPENKGVLNVTKNISSKCVGGSVSDQNTGDTLKNIQNKHTLKESCEFNKREIKRSDPNTQQGYIQTRVQRDIHGIKKISNPNKETNKIKNYPIETKNRDKLSSDSSIERIYNLESSTSDTSEILSISNDDKLKGCYSLSLKNNSKSCRREPQSELRRPTIIEKANEILKQGLSWIRESSKDLIGRENFTKAINKEVSVTSSPPSLTARSVSSTKFLSPKASVVSPSKTERLKDSNKKEKSLKEETKAEDVRTMFKLWEKKFNFEDESNIPNAPKTGNASLLEEKDIDISKNNDLKDTQAQDHKKSKNIFSFFRKKNKDKSSFKGKKVTAGRCELGDGIVIKIALDDSSSITSSKKIDDTKIEKNILQHSWLKKFVTNSGDSQKSVQLRWDNKTYGTSSNTISELKNYTFHDASIILQSNTKLSPKVTSRDDNHPKHSVNFKQDIKACMIPKTICQTPVNKNCHTHDNKKIFPSNSKKFKAKSKNHIEIFLPASSRNSNKSSEYITIHIPEEYFSEDSEDQNQYTDEEVYNIVEYESNKSDKSSFNILKDDKIAQKFHTGDYLHNDTKENRQIFQACRGVVLQQSNACLPKVIKVGVITHRDNITCLEKSMKSQDNPNESQNRQPQRKCDLAENYLLDYCRNVIPHGLDLDTSQISESQWQLISLNSSDNYSNSGQCTDLINVMSSKSSTERSCEVSKIKDWKQIHTHHFFSKIRKKTCSPLPPCNIRTCPKDSIEVCKKRKIYACSNKSKWGNNSIDEKPNTDGKISAYSTETDENCTDPCTDINERPLDGILKFKGVSDCSNCKKNEKLPRKAATVNPDSICQIPQPPCLEKCSSVRNPICTKTNSPTCHARSPECLSQELKVSQTEPSQTKVTQTKSHQVTPSSSHAICLNAKKSDAKRETADETSQIDCFCSGEENVLPTSQSTDPLKETLPSGHYVPPPVCPLDPNSYCCCKPNSSSFTSRSKATISSPKNITTTFYQRSLNISNRKKCNCIGKRNIVTSKCAPDDPNCNTNMNTKKDSSNLLNTKLSPKSSSKKEINDSEMRAREDGNSEEAKKDEEERKDNKKSALTKSESAKDKSNKIESMNSNKKFSTKEKTDKFEGINRDEIESTKQETNGIEGVNREGIPKKKEGSKEKANKIEKPNCDEILNDVYKDPTQMIKEQKSLDNSGIQRKLSISDIIEINICLKFKNTGASKSRIKPQYAYNVDEKSDIQNISTNYFQTCPANENEGCQIKGQTEDMNITINIQSVRLNCNSSNNNSLSNARMFKTDNSINYSEHFLHDHRPTLDFTNSINKVTFANEQIANFEMTCGTDFASSKATDSSIVINEDVTENYSNNNNTTENNSETSDFNSHYKIEVINDLQKEIEKNEDALSANESIKDIVNRKLVSILKKLQRNEKKEVLKQILEIVGNMNCERKGKKVKRIKHLMQAVLTSDSEHDQENDIKSTRRPLDNPSKNTLNHTGCCYNKKVNVEEQNCCCNQIEIETKNCCCKNVESDKKICYKKVDVSKESSEIEQGISAQEEENLKAESFEPYKAEERKRVCILGER
ncbi:uncharacterized protein LOC121739820 isoform X2 [Aricia agestis]|uniref:uncharacterized protein LOC121739820 isoform X2 n=1 Tax=Aricia agestis TaxID=91739 RepID=UPI001C20C35D|nr:uncharacterized protein LOC121739820 isoform X2 [Aricia agestis]